ncbi:hypothetical protein J2X01_003868 [Arthrobacter ginsengisoli]|uniref:Uncharacterized protein n=1 Tax=Arthrobacter ginsengisoli TaxID=1356565 RepID=A0ABU1UH95_9MICC|nr:hypothetical protein [Arthrobacter ginsengisoli]MDR7084557.1 hypothetical protein [Arthrobacter ginsengisoli]
MTDSSEDDPLFARLLEQQLTALERLYGESESMEEALEIVTRQRDGVIAELRGIVADLNAFDVAAFRHWASAYGEVPRTNVRGGP